MYHTEVNEVLNSALFQPLLNNGKNAFALPFYPEGLLLITELGTNYEVSMGFVLMILPSKRTTVSRNKQNHRIAKAGNTVAGCLFTKVCLLLLRCISNDTDSTSY